MTNKNKFLSVRTDENMEARVNKVAAWLCSITPGMLEKQSHATRACLLEGLAVMEAKMQASTVKAKPKRR